MTEKMDKNEFLKKIEKLKTEHKLDLSLDEDLSIAIMNLVSLEEHFYFTGAKTKKSKYYNLLLEVREMRKTLLKKIVKDPEGEEWCISKHLLASSMRLIEVGTKYQAKGKKDEAKNVFSMAYDLYSLFWGVNLGLIENSNVTESAKGIKESSSPAVIDEEENVTKRLNSLVDQLVDCCDE